MAEAVQTGGLMKFQYPRGVQNTLDPDKKREIREAYEKADERERKEKRNRNLFWIIAGLILLAIFIYFLTR